jgi:tetratricopeptide (TPR) repeat protein
VRWKILISSLGLSLWLALPAGGEESVPVGDEPQNQKATTLSTWQPSAEELAEFQAMSEAVQGFQEQVEQYRQEIQHIIATRYEERKAAVLGSYNRAIDDLEKQEAELRLRAIEVFERFLARYPDSPRYTPSALWRLAELHYEKAKLDYSAEEESYQQKLAAFNRGELKVEPQPPRQHFERTIELLQKLVRRFPDYELSDGAYYLLAFSLQEQGEAEQAQQTYQAFLRRFPRSKLVPEVYTRLGESYFDDPNRLEQALVAYQKVLEFPDSRMYDKALYKLAWTYYKLDRFEEAVDNFDKLIVWADAGKKEGEEGEVDRGELRGEALQYLAISFAEEAWSGGGVENAKAFFAARGGRSYDGEFFRKLGETYFTLGAYENAVSAWREAIRRYPLHRDNPKLLASIVDAYYRMRQSDQAARAQEEMVAALGANSEWRKANSQDPEAIALADKLAENAMYTAAVRHHTLAQKLKEQNRPQEAQEEYRLAAKVYGDYLQTFPGSRDNYKLTFYLAECYYYSLDFEKAAEAYLKVRDSSESKRISGRRRRGGGAFLRKSGPQGRGRWPARTAQALHQQGPAGKSTPAAPGNSPAAPEADRRLSRLC